MGLDATLAGINNMSLVDPLNREPYTREAKPPVSAPEFEKTPGRIRWAP